MFNGIPFFMALRRRCLDGYTMYQRQDVCYTRTEPSQAQPPPCGAATKSQTRTVAEHTFLLKRGEALSGIAIDLSIKLSSTHCHPSLIFTCVTIQPRSLTASPVFIPPPPPSSHRSAHSLGWGFPFSPSALKGFSLSIA